MKRRSKPLGWPDYMEAKTSSGVIRYYWNAPSWARKRDCPVKSEPLGTDYAIAKARCDTHLNPIFDSWRTGGATDADTKIRVVVGSFDWLSSVYKASTKYTKKPESTRTGYDRALRDVAEYVLTDGRRFGSLLIKSITPTAVDRLYEKLKFGKDGKPRMRSALASMTICKLAWTVAARAHPTIVPVLNPFKGIEIEYEAKSNRSATLSELRKFVAGADADGLPSLGTAAMVGFYWLQREEDIFKRLAWSDYCSPAAPEHVLIWHHKNRKSEKIALPMFDDDGTPLWPELVSRLETVAKTGTLIVMRDAPDPRKKVHLPWMTGGKNQMRYVQSEVRRICRSVGLPDELSFTSFRHGGNTDGGDSDLTDAQLRALSGHKSTAALLRYAKETETQRKAGARKRLDARTKKGNLSE